MVDEFSTPLDTPARIEPMPAEYRSLALPSVADLLPSLGNMRAILTFFVMNPKAFITISTAIDQIVNGQTAVAKWDNGVNPLGHAVAVYLDSLETAEHESSIFSAQSEDELADLVCTKALAVRGVRALGVQGSTGLQINRGEVLRFARMLLQQALPLLLPLLLKK